MDRGASIAGAYPRFPLTTLPTPLERAHGFERALGEAGAAQVPRIHIKRDDLLSLAMGGNKIRNLEFSIGQALEEGATDVVTAGRSQSNHCRLTAAGCVKAGLRPHLVMMGREPAVTEANLLLDGLFGARVYYTNSDDRADRQRMVDEVAGSIREAGGRSLVIPVGGADARGAVGHALNALEIAAQCEVLGEQPDAIVLATATGGTQAGLLAGIAAEGRRARVIGYHVSDTNVRPAVEQLSRDVATMIGAPVSSLGEVTIDGSQRGAGYGVPSSAGVAAIELLARSEGVVLDPVYTGKAFAGLIAAIRAGHFAPSESVVFLHTGGTPTMFADLGAARG
jgi:1-aminocyclopropane-1-carboxylate deaminase/D-cysteine desulfhydrase-like pyridoxal-dependent ACC family enzyme